MFVAWSAVAPPAPGVDVNAPRPGPEAMRPEVCPELVLHELACHQKVLEQLADKVHRMETRFSAGHVVHGMENYLHLRVDTKMPPIPDKVPAAPARVVGQKSVPLSLDMSSVPGPLPEGLRKGVEWSTVEPSVVKKERKSDPFKFGAIGLPTAPLMSFGAGGKASSGSRDLDSLEKETLVADIKTLDALLSTCLHGFRRSGASWTMKEALRTQGDGRNDNLSLDALRQQWQKELSNRASTDTDMPSSE
jgi:hypothetical protein